MRAAENCMSYWFPPLHRSGAQVPLTLMRTGFGDGPLMLAYGEPWAGKEDFLKQIGCICADIGFPCFLRTGMTSAKHGWKETCFVDSAAAVEAHVAEIITFSACADMMGLPCDVWAARQLLPLRAGFTAFYGSMPVAREFRCFVMNGTVQCLHPYWPPGAIAEHNPSNPRWREFLETRQNVLAPGEYDQIAGEAERISKLPEFAAHCWSMDFAQTTDGKWWVLDMALGGNSYHWEGCPNG